MGELDTRHGAMRGYERRAPLQLLDMSIFIYPKVLWADAAPRLHRRGLREYKTGAAHGTAAEMHKVPVVGETVLAAVLAHRRDRNAVTKADFANLQGREKVCVQNRLPRPGVTPCLRPVRSRSCMRTAATRCNRFHGWFVNYSDAVRAAWDKWLYSPQSWAQLYTRVRDFTLAGYCVPAHSNKETETHASSKCGSRVAR